MLSDRILKEYNTLRSLVRQVPSSLRLEKNINMGGSKASITDLIAYQIGWGKALIRWYEAGILGQLPVMPGDGFSKWHYAEIARHFYTCYAFSSSESQECIFEETVHHILKIVAQEHATCNLDKLGVWPWCTLSSGKQWPLSKWIQVNTTAPYKRASLRVKQVLLDASTHTIYQK